MSSNPKKPKISGASNAKLSGWQYKKKRVLKEQAREKQKGSFLKFLKQTAGPIPGTSGSKQKDAESDTGTADETAVCSDSDTLN